MKQFTRLNIIMILCFIVGLLAGLLLSTSIGYGQTYSKDNLSLYLDKKHQSIDTTGEYNKFISKPKHNNIMNFQITILDYKPNKWFHVLLICLDQPMDSLKLHVFAGYEVYNNLLFICETIYGDNTDDYIGTLDEELFTLNLQQCKQQILSVGE